MTPSLPAPAPGTIARETITLIDPLPTGQPETVPVIVANGAGEGPTLWVTGTVHGDEVTATAVCQDLVHPALVDDLAGRLVVVPIVNPAGLRGTSRYSYDDEDPNRLFPDVDYVKADADPETTVDGPRPPSQQALVCRRLFDLFAGDADAMLDIHTATVHSHPFVIQDRVLYGRGLRDADAARALASRVTDLAAATGLPTVFEYPPAEYIDENLHRSASGAALNQAGIPALTVELGSPTVVDDDLHRQGVATVARVLDSLGMVDDAVTAYPPELGTLPSPIEAPTAGQVRRFVGPHVPAGDTGIVRHTVAAGDEIDAGDTVAEIVDPAGDPASATELSAPADGWVLCRLPGVAGYEHMAVTWLALTDDSDPIGTPEE